MVILIISRVINNKYQYEYVFDHQTVCILLFYYSIYSLVVVADTVGIIKNEKSADHQYTIFQ